MLARLSSDAAVVNHGEGRAPISGPQIHGIEWGRESKCKVGHAEELSGFNDCPRCWT